MWKRTTSKKLVYKCLSPYLSEIKGRDWREALEDEENIFLIRGLNLAIFEKEKEGVYIGHYFFSKRGKEAKELANEALDEIFKIAKVVLGLTPINNRSALIMSRWLGFKSHGVIETFNGPCELFILTKEEWDGKHLRRV